MVPLNILPGVSLGHHQSKARVLERKAEQQLTGGCGWQSLSFELALVCFYLDLIETTLKPFTPWGQEKKEEENNTPWAKWSKASFREREAFMSTLPL